MTKKLTWKDILDKDDFREHVNYWYNIRYIVKRRMVEMTRNSALTRGFITSLEREENDIVIEFDHIRCLNLATGTWIEGAKESFKKPLKNSLSLLAQG